MTSAQIATSRTAVPKVEALIAEARRHLGTPYRLSGASSAGVNCLGLWVLVARNLEGLEYLAEAAAPYAERAREERSGQMRHLLCQHLQVIPLAMARPGDFLLFRNRLGGAQHLALLTENRCILHADDRSGRVIEQAQPHHWHAVLVLRIPGLEY